MPTIAAVDWFRDLKAKATFREWAKKTFHRATTRTCKIVVAVADRQALGATAPDDHRQGCPFAADALDLRWTISGGYKDGEAYHRSSASVRGSRSNVSISAPSAMINWITPRWAGGRAKR